MVQCVCIIVARPDGLILTVSRKGRPQDVGLPGGKAEEGETLAEAAVRELREETGLVLSPDTLIELVTLDGDTGEEAITSSPCTAFLAKVSRDEGDEALVQEPGGGIASWEAFRATIQEDTCSFWRYGIRLFPILLDSGAKLQF